MLFWFFFFFLLFSGQWSREFIHELQLCRGNSEIDCLLGSASCLICITESSKTNYNVQGNSMQLSKVLIDCYWSGFSIWALDSLIRSLVDSKPIAIFSQSMSQAKYSIMLLLWWVLREASNIKPPWLWCHEEYGSIIICHSNTSM